MARKPRFPGIDWYCDNCGAHLNNQKYFNDHKYTWKCKECGYKNSISWDNINPGDSNVTKFLLRLLGFLSYIGFASSVMLAIAIFFFQADKSSCLAPFLIFLGLYVFIFVISIIVEFGIRRYLKFNVKNLVRVILRNVIEDITVPFMCIRELLSNFLSFITHLIPIKRKYIWHSNKSIIFFSVVYLFITILEIVVFSKIVGFGLSDWRILIINGIEWLKQQVPEMI